jgi:aldehyde:ferredoxin oxidoreductase
VTGWDFSATEVRQIGERINTVKKLFNQREGWQPQDDWLPPRLLSELLPAGVAQGVALTPAELREMIQGYYNARGWDESGFVSEEKQRELHLVTFDEPSLVSDIDKIPPTPL